MKVRIKRVYEPPGANDGVRVLVDRLWPRGLSKKVAAIDIWAKDLAPSSELRKWFAHEDDKFEEFARRYQIELDAIKTDVEQLLDSAEGRKITLVYGAKNSRSNNAVVLRDWLEAI